MNKQGRKTVVLNFRSAMGKSFRRRKDFLFASAMIVLGLILSLSFVRVPISSAQGSAPFIWQVHVMESDKTGLSNPVGLAFSSRANAFEVLEGRGQGQPPSVNTDLIKLTAFADRVGIARIAAAVQNPINLAFDNKVGRLLLLQNAAQQLLEVREGADGNLDMSTMTHYDAKSFGLQDPQGMTVDDVTGALFILDAVGPRIVRVEPGVGGSFEGVGISEVDLGSSGLVAPRGIAFDPMTGHLHVNVPAEQKLVELSQSGEVIATRDLTEFGLQNPQGIVFAPSADQTDDPAQVNLFVADGASLQSTSQIVELSLVTPASLPAGTTLLPATLVHTFDTSNKAWNPSSPDPSGVDYWPLTGRLLISDSEVDEMSIFTGDNVYDATLSGTLVSTCSTTNPSRTGFSNEPTGVGINPDPDPDNTRIYFSDDDANKINEVALGPDREYCTADDVVTSVNVGSLYNIQDAEDVAFAALPNGNNIINTIFVGGGIDGEVYRIPLGPNGVLGGGDDGPMTHFDTAAWGFHDLEGIGYNLESGTLFIVSTKGSENYLGETTTSGTLIHAYDLSFMGTRGNLRSDVAYAPSSQNPSLNDIYIVSRGVDNDKDPNENDGKAWEISISGSGTPSPSQTPVNTNTPTPTFTPGPSPTPTNTPSVTDLIFRDGFDESGDLSRWTSNVNDSGDLSVSGAAALVGTRGMQAVIDDNNSIFVTDDTPNAEPRYRARFYFDPNSITMASGDAHFMFKGFMGTSTNVLHLEFRFSSGAYQLRAGLLNDSSVWVNMNWFTISDVAHFIELDWRAATAVGTNDGGLTLWIDGAQQANLTGVDNDTWRLDRARLGALSGIDAGTRGTYYFDAFESRRQTYIGP